MARCRRCCVPPRRAGARGRVGAEPAGACRALEPVVAAARDGDPARGAGRLPAPPRRRAALPRAPAQPAAPPRWPLAGRDPRCPRGGGVLFPKNLVPVPSRGGTRVRVLAQGGAGSPGFMPRNLGVLGCPWSCPIIWGGSPPCIWGGGWDPWAPSPRFGDSRTFHLQLRWLRPPGEPPGSPHGFEGGPFGGARTLRPPPSTRLSSPPSSPWRTAP